MTVPAPLPATPPAPETFGRYELLLPIGVGGMAEVFVARCGELEGYQTLVALKRVLPGLARDPSFVELFQREARIGLRLAHRGIARLIEVGRVGSSWFLAMELVQGETLARVIEAARAQALVPSAGLVAHVGAEIASALHHVHTLTDADGQPLGIVHRDVSPQNLMLSFDGAVKLIDFGIARAAALEGQSRAGQVRGKLRYCSPEQARGQTLDARADIYALAVVLYEWLAGAPPLPLDPTVDLNAALDTIAHRPAAPLPSSVPARLRAVTMAALEKTPQRRPATAEVFATELAACAAASATPGPALVAEHVRGLFPQRLERWRRIVADAARPGAPVTLATTTWAVPQRNAGGTVADEGTSPAAAPRTRRPPRVLVAGASVAALALGAGLVWRAHSAAVGSTRTHAAPAVAAAPPTLALEPAQPAPSAAVAPREPPARATPAAARAKRRAARKGPTPLLDSLAPSPYSASKPAR